DEQPDQAQTQQPAATQPYQSSSQQSAPGIEQQWRTYRSESGKTLAQLFREHGLPATDVYAMARGDGAGTPRSTVRSG
ncbi:LysM-like peptidoglycan-binding domain-containing protein, partial [Klebsiella pneumoniae]|uniref:LysM-like peptidoglycan-binding domain-containing protein n=1 Tax=Klebsiella pneumoniae TaxID=573 RepID=UPI0027311962